MEVRKKTLTGMYASAEASRLSDQERAILRPVADKILSADTLFEPYGDEEKVYPAHIDAEVPGYAGDFSYAQTAMMEIQQGNHVPADARKMHFKSVRDGVAGYLPHKPVHDFMQHYFRDNLLAGINEEGFYRLNSFELKNPGVMAREKKELAENPPQGRDMAWRAGRMADKYVEHVNDVHNYRPNKLSFRGPLKRERNASFTKAEIQFAKRFVERFPETLVGATAVQECGRTYLQKLYHVVNEQYPNEEDASPSGQPVELARKAIEQLYKPFDESQQFYDTLIVAVARRYFMNHGGKFRWLGNIDPNGKSYRVKDPDWEEPTKEDFTEAFAECFKNGQVFKAEIYPKKHLREKEYEAENASRIEEVPVGRGESVLKMRPAPPFTPIRQGVGIAFEAVQDVLHGASVIMHTRHIFHPGREKAESICPGGPFIIKSSAFHIDSDTSGEQGTLFYEAYKNIRDQFKVQQPERYEAIKDELVKTFGPMPEPEKPKGKCPFGFDKLGAKGR